MKQVAEISNLSNSLSAPIQATFCNTFALKLRGLMFAPSIATTEGLLFVETSDSKINSSIHMLFMNFDITVVWMDRQLQVVDVILAKKWRPAYFPTRPASYTLEIHPSRFAEFHVGDQIALKNG